MIGNWDGRLWLICYLRDIRRGWWRSHFLKTHLRCRKIPSWMIYSLLRTRVSGFPSLVNEADSIREVNETPVEIGVLLLDPHELKRQNLKIFSRNGNWNPC